MSPTLRLESLARAERIDAMMHWFSHDSTPLEFTVAEDYGLGGRLTAPSVGPIRIPEMLISGAKASLRRPARPRSSGPALLHVNVAIGGMSAVRQLDRQAWLPPGALTLSSTKYAVECVQAKDSHHFTYAVPYDALGLPHPLVDSLLAEDVMRRSPVASTVSGFLLGLAEDVTKGAAAQDALAPSIIEMLRALITTAGGAQHLAQESLAKTLHPRVMQYLELHVFEQDLTAARIAHHHGVSVRYLYAVLEREGVALGAWIRRRRADEAARLLAEPRSHLSIADVAYRTGYADQAHFSRSFRRWYGVTPTEWRRSRSTS